MMSRSSMQKMSISNTARLSNILHSISNNLKSDEVQPLREVLKNSPIAMENI
jgi:hypothetical protein